MNYTYIINYINQLSNNDEVLKFLMNHNIEAIVYEELFRHNDLFEIKELIKPYAINKAFLNAKNYRDSLGIIELFNESKIPYCVIKGPVVAQAYSKPHLRYMCDIDIWINSSDEAYIKETFIEKGYRVDEHEKPDKEFKLIKNNKVIVEVHRDLFNESSLEKIHLDTDYFWSDRQRIEIDGFKVWTMDPIKHFEYLLLHFLVHFKGNGVGLKQLFDIIHFVEAEKINPYNSLNYFIGVNYSQFFLAIMQLCETKFHMKTQINTRTKYVFSEDSITQIFNYIVGSGTYGSVENFSGGLYMNYIAADTDKERYLKILRGLFPSKNKLVVSGYHYANACFLLVPVAMIHRLVEFIIDKDISWKNKLFFINGKKSYIVKAELYDELNLRVKEKIIK